MAAMRKIIVGMLLLASVYTAHAQFRNGALVVATCSTLPQQYAVGSTRQLTVNTNGQVCR